jgi:flagellar biosynthesis protein FlhB
MSPDKPKIKEYADGWITEREGTTVPGFLKLAYIVIAAGAATYFFKYMYGEVNHADRGPLVRALNAATEASGSLMYAIAALIVIYGIIVVAFSFGKHD